MLNRLKTIGKQTHNLGRIALSTTLDLKTTSLIINVDKARDLPQTFAESSIFVRIQIHKKKQSEKVVASLFANTQDEKRTSTTWRSEFHFATLYPSFQQEVEFALRDIWNHLDEYRLYVAVMAAPSAHEDVSFIGCFSFSFEELAGTRPLQWTWLLTKSKGLVSNESVNQEEYPVDPAKNIRISGRRKGLANEFINNVYVMQDFTEGGRPVYQAAGRGGLFLYFHETRGAWAIGDSIGSSAPYAYTDDRAGMPDLVLQPWTVFSIERTYLVPDDGGSDKKPNGVFVVDHNVTCSPVIKAQPSPAPSNEPTPQPPARVNVALRRSSSIKVTREMKLQELVMSMTNYMNQLRLIDGYYNELQTSLTEEEHQQLFVNFPEVLHSTAEWTKQLRARQWEDPEFTKPVGELLLNGVNMLAGPLVDFCLATQHHAELIQQMKDNSPAIADDIDEVQQLMKTEVTFNVAITAPQEQAVILQQIIAFIVNATPIFHSDRDLVLQARNVFDNICGRVLGRQAKPNFTLSPPSLERKRSLRTSVRHSGYFDDTSLHQSPHPPSSSSSSSKEANSNNQVSTQTHHLSMPAAVKSPSILGQSDSVSSGGLSFSRNVSTANSITEEEDESTSNSHSQPPWLHGELNKSQVERLLTQPGLKEGAFLVHERMGYPGQYVLALVYHGRPSFHLVQMQQGIFTVNYRRLTEARTLTELVEALKHPQPEWPQVLTTAVEKKY